MAAAALYLGCKLAETPRRVQDLVHVHSFLDWLDWKNQELRKMQSCQQTVSDVKTTSSALEALDSKLFSLFLLSSQVLHSIQSVVLSQLPTNISL